MVVDAQHFVAAEAVGIGFGVTGIVYATRWLMMSTLLLPSDILLSSDDIKSIFGRFALLVLACLLVGWWGVALIKRDKWIGFAVVLVAAALPIFGWRLL